MHRLVAYAPNGVRRFVVDRSVMVLGSDPACDIRLPYAGVGDQHARLHADEDGLRIEDLGSRRGVMVNGDRVRGAADLQVLDEIRLGSIALLLEDQAVAPVAPAPEAPTLTPAGLLAHLAQLSRWVLSDATSHTSLESLVTDLLRELGGGVIFLFQGDLKQREVRFVVTTDGRWLACGEMLAAQADDGLRREAAAAGQGLALDGALDDGPAWLVVRPFRVVDRPHLFVAALPRFRPDAWSPMDGLRTLADLIVLGLVHHVGRYEPILLGRTAQPELVLAPGLVVGEAPATRRLLAHLRAAVPARGTVLLRGEAGMPKELLARSLHLSGARREGPFVVASCRGVPPERLEAELFGAEIAGRQGTVVRDGKLREADAGVLYLDHVDELPMPLQDRLVRFLRTGQVEPAGSLASHAADVQLIVAADDALEELAARDRMRLDLAYRLSQVALDVPPLRSRREDLPLLIQTSVNRSCHERGVRVQGITVKALEALTIYDYPGNLIELEAIVRQMVFLCPPGQPIGESLLPEAVRMAELRGTRPEHSSDLDLARLVTITERAAIREALRRSSDNKSAAARLLGLSRNGLAMKIKRLQLDESRRS
ncbi:MAG: sigma 54-interacting transcriptional regulator [Acidobacteriota bacterium]